MKITSHILDTTRGVPAAGVRVALARRGAAGEWREIATGITDADGRVADLLAGAGDGLSRHPRASLSGGGDGGIGDGVGDGDGHGGAAGDGLSGEFKLTFHTADYHRARGADCFHPRVEVAFTVDTVTDAHYHIPLLLSPFGYTTYRGS